MLKKYKIILCDNTLLSKIEKIVKELFYKYNILTPMTQKNLTINYNLYILLACSTR